MRIGELASRADVPAKTIRYYEQIGLLAAPSRTSSGYRDYKRSAVDRLSFVRAAQSVGLSLGEIREILAFRDRGETPCVHVASLIQRHAEDLSERITALERMRKDLASLARKARTVTAHDAEGARFCHIIETIVPAPKP